MVTSPAPPCLVTAAATVSCRRQLQPQRPPRPRVIQATAKASKAKARLVQQPVAKCPVHTTGLQPPRPSFHISTRPTVTAGNSLKSRPQTPNKGLRGCHYHRTSIHAHLQVSSIGSTQSTTVCKWEKASCRKSHFETTSSILYEQSAYLRRRQILSMHGILYLYISPSPRKGGKE